MLGVELGVWSWLGLGKGRSGDMEMSLVEAMFNVRVKELWLELGVGS